jgi:pyridoxine 5-phosphate synthase
MNPLIAPEANAVARHAHTALSVNVNKVATLRNTRRLGTPSPLRASELCLQAGADGITVHPRPDERHIRLADVIEIAELLRQWPQAEFNVEGNPFHNLMDVLRVLQARGLPLHQLTFVPDSQGQLTSDHGFDVQQDGQRLRPLVQEAQAAGVRVSLFMDPLPEAMAEVRAIGADRVELYTEPFAHAFAQASGSTGTGTGTGTRTETTTSTGTSTTSAEVAMQLQRYAAAARAAFAAGLGVNAGHDLNRDNLGAFVQAVPGVAEVSIGHALIGDALELGYAETVRAYQRILRAAASARAGTPAL